MVIALLFGSAETALAEGNQGEGGSQESSPQPIAIPPGGDPEAARKAYLTLLFQEINLLRDRAPTPRYDYMTDTGSEAVDEYLKDLLPVMEAADACFHGSDHPDVASGWDYLEAVGIDESTVGGEVLACPDVGARRVLDAARDLDRLVEFAVTLEDALWRRPRARSCLWSRGPDQWRDGRTRPSPASR